jgi:amino acid transporter
LLAAIPWGFLAYGGFNFGTYFSGETKNVKSTMFRSLFFSVAISTLLMVLFYLWIYHDFGPGFINAASYVAANNPSSLPTLPTVTVFVGLLNPIVGILVNVGLFVGWVVVCCVYTLEMARMVFAAAFDRLIPTGLSAVNHRFHSPHWAIIFIGMISAAYMTIYWNFGFAATWLNVSLVLPIAFILPLVATAAFPVVRPELFKRTLGHLGYGSWVIIGSIVGVVCFLFYIFAETFPIISGVFLGASLAVAYGIVVATAAVGTLLYFTAKLRARRLGLDISQVYAEIPPE